MDEEMASLDKNEAWDLVDFSTRRNPIGSKWVFKKKLNAEGKVEKYKARLVEKGYSQVEGIDFSEIFYPVSKSTSIIFLLSMLIFSKSQLSFSLADFSVKFKCQTQFQHCFNICYSLVF
jgi:hypothetical protein